MRLERKRSWFVFVSVLVLAVATAIIYVARDPIVSLSYKSYEMLRHALIAENIAASSTWRQRDPAELGISIDKLDEFRLAIGRNSSGCVIKDGALIFSWGHPNRNGDWGSTTKPVISTLLLFAIQEGLIESIDEPVRKFVPGLSKADQAITFRQLANMTSGYSLPDAPGEAWAYNDYGAKLYFRTVFEGVFGTSLTDVNAVQDLLQAPHRLGPLGFEDGDLFRIRKGAPRLDMSPRDFARVGELWLRMGAWDGKQILERELSESHMEVGLPSSVARTAGGEPNDYLQIGSLGGGNDHYAIGPGSYGFTLWFNESRQLWPDVPEDAFQANGHRNREALTVVPSLGLVVAWLGGDKVTDKTDAFNRPMNDALRLLIEALPKRGRSPEIADAAPKDPQ